MRPVEIRRLENARHLSSTEDPRKPITAFAERIGKGSVQVQNLIGKTPKKPIGKRIAEEIEQAYKLLSGELDEHWPNGLPPSWADKGPASTAPDYRDSIEAMQYIAGSIITALAATQRDAAQAVYEALHHKQVPSRFRERGPIADVLDGLQKQGFRMLPGRASAKSSRQGYSSKR